MMLDYSSRIWAPAFNSAALILLCCLVVGAAIADDIKMPADPVAKAAFEMLDRHCARCHQVGRLKDPPRPAKGFGNVLKLDELAATPHLVIPGNPFSSQLFKQIVNAECPYDIYFEGAPGVRPSIDEIRALETWIQSLGTPR